MLKHLKILVAIASLILVLSASTGGWFVVQHYEPSYGQAEQEAKDKGKSDATNLLASERVAYYTKVLAIFSGTLSAFGLLQIWFLIRADSTTRQSVDLARDEFDASHRTQLEVRFVREVPGGVQITVINTGTGSASFVRARAAIYHLQEGDALPSPHDLMPASDLDLRSRFDPSEMQMETVTHPADEFTSGYGGTVHVFGWIVYDTVAPTPVRRTTYFGRKVEAPFPELVFIIGSDWNFIQ